MPRSPKSTTPHSRPPPIASRPDWWSAASRTPASLTRCSRCGGITRFSPTPTCPSIRPSITHRQHAIIETVFADLIDGPLAHSPGPVRRELGLGAVREHRPQPAARGRCPGRRAAHPSTRIDTATHHRQRSRPTGPSPAPPDPAPTRPLAVVQVLACTVAQHHRIQPTTTCDNLTNPPKGPTGTHRC